ncbi:MAG TPA: pyridoxal phosphate-dependent aminotransferase [Candidatus Acidoferrales bacterium]|nr:pyridoxal phosphate-dependent aminotransferase [Candidatus Acidoferrales bacterium]
MRELSERVRRIHLSPIRKVAGLLDEARKRSDIISFGGGAPSLPPPEGFLEEFTRLLQTNALRSCGYTGTKGIPELRAAVAADVKRYGNVGFDPAREITLTTGATEAIYNVFMSLIDPGDEVIITDPTYLGYRETIELAQGQVKFLPVEVEDGYQPDSEQLTDLVSKKTKAVLLLSPDNPTGRIVKEDFVKTLIDLAQDYDFWIISDEIYKHIIYEGKHLWVSSFPGAKDRTITICSFSKEASIPGLRLGYTMAPREIIDAIEKMQQYSTLAPETLAQFALVKYLNEDMKSAYLRDVVLPQYAKRREQMGKMIETHLPLAQTTRPAGAFYYFVDMREYLSRVDQTEEEFTEQLLNQTGVAIIPGRYFGDNGTGHVRMTFVTEPVERIEEGIRKVAQFLNAPNTERTFHDC